MLVLCDLILVMESFHLVTYMQPLKLCYAESLRRSQLEFIKNLKFNFGACAATYPDSDLSTNHYLNSLRHSFFRYPHVWCAVNHFVDL